MENINVLLVDDHPLVRSGLRSMLAPYKDINVVGEADNAEYALAQALKLAPDVVLLDVRLTGASGLAIIRQLKNNTPSIKVAVLTTFDEDEYLFEAVKAGASAYLLKTLSCEELVEAIRRLSRGEYILSESLTHKLMHGFHEMAQERENLEWDLSAEEIDILRKIARGATNVEIGKEMCWSVITVKKKVTQILRKLSAVNRAQAVVEANRRGMID